MTRDKSKPEPADNAETTAVPAGRGPFDSAQDRPKQPATAKPTGPARPGAPPQGPSTPPRTGAQQGGLDEVYHQRVFDPVVEDTVPVRDHRPIGANRDRAPERPRAPATNSPRPAGTRPTPGNPREQRGTLTQRPASDPRGGRGTTQQRPGTPGGYRGQRGGPRRQPRRQRRQEPAQPPELTQVQEARDAAAVARGASAQAEGKELVIPAAITVRELAEKMHRSPIDVIKTLMNYGMMVPITESIDFGTAQLIGEELGVTIVAESQPSSEADAIDEAAPKTLRQRIMAAERTEDLVLRPPIVTVLGHVDHGKTTLLDAIRETRVVEGEAGGITQHIGAYQVESDGRKITFLDTPGHEAFTAMRARGASVTDIAVLVVAADDGVMPQTAEAIAHAKAAQVPIVVALNKVDKAQANPDRVKQELADNDVLIEEYGGDVMCVPVSAKLRTGIDDLLESILLAVDIDPLKANPKGDCVGTVIESRLDKTRGPTATLLVQNGTLHTGDSIATGTTYAKIRAMVDDKGAPITAASPSTPVQILGLADVPVAGNTFKVVADERTARNMAAQQQALERAGAPAAPTRTLESIFAEAKAGQVKELLLILKADVQGSIEPIVNSLEKLGDDKLKVKILHQGTGNITESDVMLATASRAIILGFSVGIDPAAQRTAENEGIDIRFYNIIYKLIEDIQKALTGLLEPVYKETVTGHAEVRAVFKVTKTGKVAGCYVTDGEVVRGAQARVLRAGQAIAEDRIATLRRFQEDVAEVKTGFECGINLHNFNDIEVGDILEVYKKERVS